MADPCTQDGFLAAVWKMKMDCNNLDQSPPYSDTNGGSWEQCWDAEDSSITGLNLENTNELHNLVEDKEIAAHAVAFVVNNTRKGIVPLCADVATLLRGRRSLEKKVARLRAENHSLRSRFSSTQTSISTSPAPTSIHSCSERGLCLHDHSSLPQDKCSTCSRSSSRSSSLTSNSPKLDKVQSNHRLPRFHRTSAFTIPASSSLLNNATQLNGDCVFQAEAVLHPSPPAVTIPVAKEHQRKDSLPQIVCEPDGDVQKVRPRISVAVQCTLDIAANTVLQEHFQETLRENSKLTAQLSDAHKEIAQLKEMLKQFEKTDTLPQQHVLKQHPVDNEFYHLENECESSETVASSTCGTSAGRAVVTAATQPKSSTQTKCCKLATENGVDSVEVGSRVLLEGDRRGRVCYIGHLDHSTTTNTIYAGVELDDTIGQHSGSVNGKQYFRCKKDCGILVPIQDIQHVINTKPPAVESCPQEQCTTSSSTVACKLPGVLQHDHHVQGARLVNEKHFVTMAHVNGRPLTKSVQSIINGHQEQIV